MYKLPAAANHTEVQRHLPAVHRCEDMVKGWGPQSGFPGVFTNDPSAGSPTETLL